MNLPSEFISIVTNTFGEDGDQLIANLPTLIEEASAQWGLTDVQPVDNLSYNFVAFASRGNEKVALLHEHLGFEHERIHAWGLAHAVLSAWWSIEDNTGWEYALAFSEMIADLPIH